VEEGAREGSEQQTEEMMVMMCVCEDVDGLLLVQIRMSCSGTCDVDSGLQIPIGQSGESEKERTDRTISCVQDTQSNGHTCLSFFYFSLFSSPLLHSLNRPYTTPPPISSVSSACFLCTLISSRSLLPLVTLILALCADLSFS
jgi:hypothetical protein